MPMSSPCAQRLAMNSDWLCLASILNCGAPGDERPGAEWRPSGLKVVEAWRAGGSTARSCYTVRSISRAASGKSAVELARSRMPSEVASHVSKKRRTN